MNHEQLYQKAVKGKFINFQEFHEWIQQEIKYRIVDEKENKKLKRIHKNKGEEE